MGLRLFLILSLFCFTVGLAALLPSNAVCVYCNPNQPCASDLDCSTGCRCYHPPYMMGVCGP